MAARLVKVFHVRLSLPQGTVNAPHPLGALNRNPVTPRVVGEAKEHSAPPVPPRKETADDSSVAVTRDDKIAVAGRGRDQHVQPVVLDDPPPKWRRRRSEDDERLSVRDIALTMAAVIAVSFAATAYLPSLLTSDAGDATVVAAAPPVQPPAPVAEVAAPQSVQPPPAAAVAAPQPAGNAGPAQTPAAPVAAAPSAVASTTPALRGIVPPEKQAASRAAPARRADLKGAEKTAAVAAPRRAAPSRLALTDEEKAAIERGLRELEKTAEQAKP